MVSIEVTVDLERVDVGEVDVMAVTVAWEMVDVADSVRVVDPVVGTVTEVVEPGAVEEPGPVEGRGKGTSWTGSPRSLHAWTRPGDRMAKGHRVIAGVRRGGWKMGGEKRTTFH